MGKLLDAARRPDGSIDHELYRQLVARQSRTKNADETVASAPYLAGEVRGGQAYTVESGDNFFSIAERIYGDQRYAEQVARAFGGVSVLRPGMVGNLPRLGTNPDIKVSNQFMDRALWLGDYLTEQGATNAYGGGQTGAEARLGFDNQVAAQGMQPSVASPTAPARTLPYVDNPILDQAPNLQTSAFPSLGTPAGPPVNAPAAHLATSPSTGNVDMQTQQAFNYLRESAGLPTQLQSSPPDAQVFDNARASISGTNPSGDAVGQAATTLHSTTFIQEPPSRSETYLDVAESRGLDPALAGVLADFGLLGPITPATSSQNTIDFSELPLLTPKQAGVYAPPERTGGRRKPPAASQPNPYTFSGYSASTSPLNSWRIGFG